MSDWNEFNEDCMHFHGKILTGEFKHFCMEFDGLPIDETCFEFKYCLCDYMDWDMSKKTELQDVIEE